MSIEDATTWASEHKAAAAAAGLGAVGLLLLLALRRRQGKTAGQTGATIPDGNTLVPYGDAQSLGYSELAGAIGGLTSGITGLTSTSTPPSATDPVAVGGNADGSAWSGAGRFYAVPISQVTPVTSRPSEATTTVTSSVATAPPKLRYTAKAGDTIWTVAPRFGITPTQFLTMNRLPQTTRVLSPGTSYRVQL